MVPHLRRGARNSLPRTALLLQPLTDPPGISAVGEISLTTHRVWQGALARLAERNDEDVLVEMSGVTFVDVGGASALALMAQGLSPKRRIVLRRPPPSLCRTLDTFWPELAAIEVTR